MSEPTMKSVIEFSEAFHADSTFDQVVARVDLRVAELRTKGFVRAESTIEPINAEPMTGGETQAFGYDCTIRAWKSETK